MTDVSRSAGPLYSSRLALIALFGMNIYELQVHNRRLTWIIVSVFMFFLIFLGLGFDVFVLGMDAPGPGFSGKSAAARTGRIPVYFPYGTVISFLGGALLTVNSVVNGADMVLKSAAARRADPSRPEERQFLNVLSEMATASGLPVPAGYIIPDPDLNAFATGLSPSKSAVAVTEGLLSGLNREELQGVVAHEMSHIRNYDVRLMTVVSALIGAVALLSDFTGRSFKAGALRGRRSDAGKSRSRGGALSLALFVIWIFLMLLAPLISRLLAMAVSRKREFLADASGAELTRNPLSLASALEKIRNAVNPTRSIHQGVAHLCIADPKGRLIEEKTGFLADIMASHPPMETRIINLKMMAYQR